MKNLGYYKLNEEVKSPKHATFQSACFDIHAHIKDEIPVVVYGMENLKGFTTPKDETVTIFPGDRILIPTGLIFTIPKDHSLRLHTRSSVSLKKGLICPNGEGIIDSDYYHETFVMLYNASGDEVTIQNGDRIAQAELVKCEMYGLVETTKCPEQTTNRSGGFGSTGVK